MSERASTETTPFVDRLIEPGDVPRLRCGRCPSCGTTMFPSRPSCPSCRNEGIETVALGPRGTLWSYTVQCFEPVRPPFAGFADFAPFGVGYVALDGIIVESRLTVDDPGRLRIGQEMELTTVPFGMDPTGAPRYTYAFAPIGD